MGPLQPGLPSSSMVPKGWSIIIIDLQDYFFTIPLHPKDRKRFAFSVPSINHMAPVKRFQWKVATSGNDELSYHLPISHICFITTY